MLFPTPLTHTFLPSLYKTSLSHLIIVFHSSFSVELAIPHIPLHFASKAFVK
jgi:short-subunit dehydrogenase